MVAKESLFSTKVHKTTTYGQTTPKNVVKPMKISQGTWNKVGKIVREENLKCTKLQQL